MIRNIWAIRRISSWYWRAENILKYFGKQRENISNLVAAAPALAPRPAPGVQQLEAEGGEVGEDAQQVYDVHPALDEPGEEEMRRLPSPHHHSPDLVRSCNKPDHVLEGEPAHEHRLRDLEEVLLPWEKFSVYKTFTLWLRYKFRVIYGGGTGNKYYALVIVKIKPPGLLVLLFTLDSHCDVRPRQAMPF